MAVIERDYTKPFYWLNNDSRLFLSRGYIKEDIKAEDRVKEISKRAENILTSKGHKEFEGFSEKFYDYMSKGYFSLASPVWSNFGTTKGLPISCITGETWVNTSEGGKQAKDIEIGDLVLTHKNRFRKVVKVIPTKDKEGIYSLKVGTRMTELFVTGDHLILTDSGWKRVDELEKGKDLIAVNGELEYEEQKYVIDMKKYVDYEYVIEDGLIKKAIENKRPDKSKRHNKSQTHVTYYSQVPEYVEVDEELAWAIGVWFADGSVSRNNKKEPNGIRITTSIENKEEVALKWLSIIEKKFNINGSHYETNIERNGSTNSWISVNANSGVVGNLFNSFGSNSKTKQLNKELLNMPKENLMSFLYGVLNDGTYYPDKDSYKLTLSNPELLLQIYNIGLKLNKKMSLQMKEKAPKLATTPYVYTLVFNDFSRRKKDTIVNGIEKEDGLYYARIMSLEKTNKVEDVYDFTVEQDHSFSVNGVVVHNCFGSFIEDDMGSILYTAGEVGMMSKMGGGTSGYFGNLRGRGSAIGENGESSGAVHFMKLFEQVTDTISQGGVRRGRFSPYLPIDHPDIDEFLEIGTEGNEIQDLNHAVTVTDDWMQDMIAGDREKRTVWAKVLQRRVEVGYPYIMFVDTANKNKPAWYKDHPINNSNLCSEIMLPNNERWSFVCNLSSMNLERYHEWKDTDAVETMIYFLDAVMEEFIIKLEALRNSENRGDNQSFYFMERSYNFAKENRALGLGVN